MINPIEYTKKHPYLVGGIAFVVIAGALLFFSGGSEEETGPMSVNLPTGPDPTTVAAGLQMRQLELEGKAISDQTAAAKEISLATIAAGVTKAEYEKLTAFHVADITGQTAQLDIAAKKEVSMATINSQRDVALNAAAKAYSLGLTEMRLNSQVKQKELALKTYQTQGQFYLAQIQQQIEMAQRN